MMEIEQQILDVMRRVFGDAHISTDVSQQNCAGWDSMNHLNMVVDLEMALGLSFEPEEIAQMVSYEQVLRIVEEKRHS